MFLAERNKGLRIRVDYNRYKTCLYGLWLRKSPSPHTMCQLP